MEASLANYDVLDAHDRLNRGDECDRTELARPALLSCQDIHLGIILCNKMKKCFQKYLAISKKIC